MACIPGQIRVVNAFRHGVDGTQLQQASLNPNVQRVLQRQASLSKRMSTCSSINEESLRNAKPMSPTPPLAPPTTITNTIIASTVSQAPVDVETTKSCMENTTKSSSHTETAV